MGGESLGVAQPLVGDFVADDFDQFVSCFHLVSKSSRSKHMLHCMHQRRDRES